MLKQSFNKDDDFYTKISKENEISNYVEECRLDNALDGAKEVYVTDRVPREKKYNTINSKEDRDFYDYKKSLDEYNSNIVKIIEAEVAQLPEHESLTDPMPKAIKLNDGSQYLMVTQEDIATDDHIKLEYDLRK